MVCVEEMGHRVKWWKGFTIRRLNIVPVSNLLLFTPRNL